ncbi:hypothetical protein FHU10_1833 [Serratia fonticola]|jgi:hypothetical protein|uniref:Uncharacterized protein n=1 Tax=Serratia fonticola TaxID=47917 RepID=A0A542BHW9_SERFO|nr:hypothetical protein [Serratia fonticola]TQI78171.1 hypothetical protein FHU09_0618 [Serratia fonticola]TQI94831.1 hypothetical protein FHU11_0174 [Serratia fonticola]TVZ69329.1 hypothetical protein FHU10_1833 [Serratia fonticola]
MYLNKLKKRFDSPKKRDRVYIFSSNKEKFSTVVEAFTVYGISTEVSLVTPAEALDIINEKSSGKTWFLVDSASYKETDIAEFAMMLRGRFQSVLVGEVNSLDAAWHAKELGYSEYFLAQADTRHLINSVLKGGGYIRSRTSRIIGLCNTSADINISYRVFEDLKKSQLMRSYSALFINCDIANIYYDAALGVRANSQIIEHITKDNDELDSVSSRKLISAFDEHFDYVSFNLAMENIKIKDTEQLIKGIDSFIDSVSDIYGFIFINVPYYMLTSPSGVNLLNNSDVRVLFTNGQIESIYNLNFLKSQIAFKKAENSKNTDKLICIRDPNEFSVFRITDLEIKSKLGIKVDYSTSLQKRKSIFDGLKKSVSDNVIDIIFR